MYNEIYKWKLMNKLLVKLKWDTKKNMTMKMTNDGDEK